MAKRTYSESTAAKTLGINRPKLVNLRKSGQLAKGMVWDESKADAYGIVSPTAPILYDADKIDAAAAKTIELLKKPGEKPEHTGPIAVVAQRDAHLAHA